MKIKIDSDEWYPVHSTESDYGTECDVPDETVARWKRIEQEFDVMQEEMSAALDRAKGKAP